MSIRRCDSPCCWAAQDCAHPERCGYDAIEGRSDKCSDCGKTREQVFAERKAKRVEARKRAVRIVELRRLVEAELAREETICSLREWIQDHENLKALLERLNVKS